MTLLLCSVGWLVALALLLELRRRARLIRDAGHEIRGPLFAISLGLEALRRQPLARRRAQALLTELSRVEAAADDIGAAARGRRAPSVAEPIRLDRLVESSADAWAPAAALAGGSVRCEWPEGATPVRADTRRLAQAFGNLLANAVEHGGGEIVVRAAPAGNAIRVEVSDSGGAVVPLRGRASRSGRGRGLVIAERVLREAGGRLESRDRPDGGRIAVAELPLDRDVPPLDPAA